MMGYLQRFAFFDAEKVGKSVIFEDLGPQLVEGGIRALLAHVDKAIQTSAPKMIVIDSFRALHDLSPSPLELRRALYELTGMLTAFCTTVFLVGEYTDADAQTLPEFSIADGIVQFMRNPLSTRDERFLRVLKLRGSGYLEGLHAFRIGAGGLEIFPRLVSPQIPETYTILEERAATGIEGLDPLARKHDASGGTDRLGQDDGGPAVRPRGRPPGRSVPLCQFSGEPDAARPLAARAGGRRRGRQATRPAPDLRVSRRAPGRSHHRQSLSAAREHRNPASRDRRGG
jgi:KaiC/GvpD/RAD55 family RecA-like ATPase